MAAACVSGPRHRAPFSTTSKVVSPALPRSFSTLSAAEILVLPNDKTPYVTAGLGSGGAAACVLRLGHREICGQLLPAHGQRHGLSCAVRGPFLCHPAASRRQPPCPAPRAHPVRARVQHRFRPPPHQVMHHCPHLISAPGYACRLC